MQAGLLDLCSNNAAGSRTNAVFGWYLLSKAANLTKTHAKDFEVQRNWGSCWRVAEDVAAALLAAVERVCSLEIHVALNALDILLLTSVAELATGHNENQGDIHGALLSLAFRRCRTTTGSETTMKALGPKASL